MANFKIGDSVRIKDGTQHADFPIEIGGWQGRISDFKEEGELIDIKLDSITLQTLDEIYILDSELDGLSWSEYIAEAQDVEPAERRDKQSDVEKIYQSLHAQSSWIHPGSGGISIAQLERWQALLQNYVTFPFKAILDYNNADFSNHIPTGGRVRVLGFGKIDLKAGLIVKVKYKYSRAKLPLFVLSVDNDKTSSNRLLKTYETWYAIYN